MFCVKSVKNNCEESKESGNLKKQEKKLVKSQNSPLQSHK